MARAHYRVATAASAQQTRSRSALTTSHADLAPDEAGSPDNHTYQAMLDAAQSTYDATAAALGNAHPKTLGAARSLARSLTLGGRDDEAATLLTLVEERRSELYRP